jgi:hypothetical protein
LRKGGGRPGGVNWHVNCYQVHADNVERGTRNVKTAKQGTLAHVFGD